MKIIKVWPIHKIFSFMKLTISRDECNIYIYIQFLVMLNITAIIYYNYDFINGNIK